MGCPKSWKVKPPPSFERKKIVWPAPHATGEVTLPLTRKEKTVEGKGAGWVNFKHLQVLSIILYIQGGMWHEQWDDWLHSHGRDLGRDKSLGVASLYVVLDTLGQDTITKVVDTPNFRSHYNRDGVHTPISDFKSVASQHLPIPRLVNQSACSSHSCPEGIRTDTPSPLLGSACWLPLHQDPATVVAEVELPLGPSSQKVELLPHHRFGVGAIAIGKGFPGGACLGWGCTSGVEQSLSASGECGSLFPLCQNIYPIGIHSVTHLIVPLQLAPSSYALTALTPRHCWLMHPRLPAS